MGLGLLIGFVIGAAVGAAVVIWQQRSPSRSRPARSQQRLAQLEQAHELRLQEAIQKLKADYRQQLAAKIERYQDEQIQQIEALESEYQARLAVLEQAYQGRVGRETSSRAASSQTAAAPVASAINTAEMTPLPDPWIPTPPGTEPPSVPASAPDPGPASASVPTPARAGPKAPPSASTFSPPALADLLTQAQSTHAAQRRESAEALGKVLARGAKSDAVRAVPLLGKLTKDPEPDVRLAAVRSLSQTPLARVVPLLRQALRDVDGEVVAAASEALARFKGAKTQPKPSKRRPKNR